MVEALGRDRTAMYLLRDCDASSPETEGRAVGESRALTLPRRLKDVSPASYKNHFLKSGSVAWAGGVSRRVLPGWLDSKKIPGIAFGPVPTAAQPLFSFSGNLPQQVIRCLSSVPTSPLTIPPNGNSFTKPRCWNSTKAKCRLGLLKHVVRYTIEPKKYFHLRRWPNIARSTMRFTVCKYLKQ